MATINLRTPNGYNGQLGTTHKFGIVRFATVAEATARVSNNSALSPATAVLAIPAASTTVAGIVFLATSAETVTGTNATKAVTPQGLTARLAAPGAIGGTTPAAGSFTVLTHGKENYTTLASGAAAGALSAGTVALSGGTIVVNTTAVTATSQVRLTCQALGTVVIPSGLCVSAKVVSTSFTILASQATDTSTIFWEVIN
jgi:hypothetical protein